MQFQNACDGAYSSLDVRFNKNCDNACSFCIEDQNGFPSQGMSDVSVLIAQTLKTGIRNVLILGGEPLLYPDKVLAYLRGIRSAMDTVYLTTSLPNTIIKHRDTFDSLVELLDGLNVSIQHHDWQQNNRLLVASSRHNRIELLRSINTKHADKVRTSINLVADGIDSKDKLCTTIGKLEAIGCKYIKINELQGSPLYVSYEAIMGVKLPSPYAHGCSTEVTIDGCTAKLLLKRSCFNVESSLDANLTDLAKAVVKKFRRTDNKFAVMYENGRLERSWIQCQK